MPAPLRNNRLLLYTFSIVALCGALTLGCSSGDGKSAENSPGAAVESFYESLNDGDYAAAKKHYSAESLEAIDVDDPDYDSEGAFKEWAELETKKGSILKVKILDSEEGETETKVSFEVQYGDGSKKNGKVSVIQEDGGWKLGLIG